MTLGLAIVQARSWGIRLKMIWRILTQGQMVIICPVIAIEGSAKAKAAAKGSHLRAVEDDEDRFDA